MELNRKCKWVGWVCGLICIFSPIAISALTLNFGATEWREDYKPVPVAARVIDSLFYFDLFTTALLIWVMRGWRGVTAVIVVPLLYLTAFIAFWGGLWVSGQWL